MANRKGNYRVVVHDPETQAITYGRFIFQGPDDSLALDAIASLRKVFPNKEIWMEDENGIRVEIHEKQEAA